MITELVYTFLDRMNAYPDIFAVEVMLRKHPAGSTIRGISDVLEKNGISNMVCRIDKNQLSEVPLPAIIHLANGSMDSFFMLDKVDWETGVVRLDAGGNVCKKVSIEAFCTIWDGVVLMAESDNGCGEWKKRVLSRFKFVLWMAEKNIHGLFLLALVLAVGLNMAEGNGYSLLQAVRILLGMGGVILSYLAVVKGGLGANVARHICRIKNKDVCKEVFSDKGAYFLNWVSLGELSLAYFFTLTVMDVFKPLSSVQMVVACMSVVAILYSLVWQFMHKKRCSLCLLIDWVLMLYIASVSVGPLCLGAGFLPEMLEFAVFFVITLLGIRKTVVLLNLQNEYRVVHDRLGMFVFSETAFKAMLSEQPVLSESMIVESLPLSNDCVENGNDELLLVISPRCRYCRDLVHIIPRLSESLNIRVFFLVDEKDRLAIDVSAGFLSVCRNTSFDGLLQAMQKWYDYNLKPEVEVMPEDRKRLYRHVLFCKRNRILDTPAIFVNRRMLPAAYSLYDLEYIFE